MSLELPVGDRYGRLPADSRCGQLSEVRSLVVCEHVGPLATGGAERVAVEVGREMVARGATVEIVTSRPDVDRARWAAVEGIAVNELPATDLRSVLRVQLQWPHGVARAVKRAMDRVKPNVVHVHTPFFPSSSLAARVAFKRGVPVVTHLHVGALDALPLGQRLPSTVFEATVARWLVRRSAAVVAVSEEVRRYAVRLGADPARVVVAPNGVDHARFAGPARERSEGVPLVVCVGRLIANKGPELLLRAAHRLIERGHEFELVFVGDGPQRKRLEAFASAGAGRDGIRFVGAVPDVERWLLQAHVAVRPSLTEGMPLAVLEAMSAGRCVIASALPGTMEVITHNHDGLLFPPGDETALERLLGAAVEDPDLRARLGDAARQRSMAFTWGTCVERTVDAYRLAGVEV